VPFDAAWLSNDYIIFNIDALNLEILGKAEETVKCPFTGASFKASARGQISPICNLCEIGKECLGLTLC
jgi:hypothetical protein